METIYAGLITVLFSAWIWDLKSQVIAVRRAAPSGRAHTPIIHADPPEMSTANRPSHIVKPNPTHVFRKNDPQSGAAVTGQEPTTQDTTVATDGHISRHNGVPVWVIE